MYIRFVLLYLAVQYLSIFVNVIKGSSIGAHYIKNNCSKIKETAKYCVKIIAQAASLHYNLCLVFHLFLLFLSAKQFKQTDFVQCALIKSC